MKCKRCRSEKSRVTEKRGFDAHNRRVRVCAVCGNVWPTVEVAEDDFGGPGEVRKYVTALVAARPEVDA